MTAMAALVLAASAQATTLVLPDGTRGPQPYQSWVDRARVPTPPGDVLLRLDGCDATLPGCAPEGERLIALEPDWVTPHVLLHELGHVFDDGMPDWARTGIQSMFGRRGPWLAAAASNPPDEQFAEAYSLCARHASIRERYYGPYRYSPTPSQHRRACALIRRAAS